MNFRYFKSLIHKKGKHYAYIPDIRMAHSDAYDFEIRYPGSLTRFKKLLLSLEDFKKHMNPNYYQNDTNNTRTLKTMLKNR